MERKGEFASEREREEIIFREREIVRESERGTLDLKTKTQNANLLKWRGTKSQL